MSRIAKLSFLILIFCAAAGALSAQQGGFNWTMALENYNTNELVPFSAPVVSGTGEKFRLVINSKTPCYCYVIFESPGGNDVAILHEGELSAGKDWYSPVMELLPPRGTESLFIITSKEQQKNLAARITAFTANSGNLQKRGLMNEIFRLRSALSAFKEAPEKPVLMGGSARGTEKGDASGIPDEKSKGEGVEYSGLEIYVKTISIEH